LTKSFFRKPGLATELGCGARAERRRCALPYRSAPRWRGVRHRPHCETERW